jgi:guanine nucleotide-binding protein subunit alpha
MRLTPLLEVEKSLMKRLSLPGSTEWEPTERPLTTTKRRQSKEIAVNSTVAWKAAFTRMAEDRHSFDTDHLIDWDDPEDPGVLLHASNGDMKRLWAHPTIQAILDKQSIRLQESAGLYVAPPPALAWADRI